MAARRKLSSDKGWSTRMINPNTSCCTSAGRSTCWCRMAVLVTMTLLPECKEQDVAVVVVYPWKSKSRKLATLGPRVYIQHLRWAVWIPRYQFKASLQAVELH